MRKIIAPTINDRIVLCKLLASFIKHAQQKKIKFPAGISKKTTATLVDRLTPSNKGEWFRAWRLSVKDRKELLSQRIKEREAIR